jgi:hypothetical protein
MELRLILAQHKVPGQREARQYELRDAGITSEARKGRRAITRVSQSQRGGVPSGVDRARNGGCCWPLSLSFCMSEQPEYAGL